MQTSSSNVLRSDQRGSLYWLPQPPPDFIQRCRSVLNSSEGIGDRINAIASYDLNENHLNRIANVLAKTREAKYALEPLIPFRLAILSNSTTDFIAPALIASAARHGIALECVRSGYGQVVQEALSPTSAIYSQQPDAVLIALDYRGYPLATSVGDVDAAKATVTAALDHLQIIREGIRTHGKAICIVQNLCSPVEQLVGNLDRITPGTFRSLVDEINQGIARSIAGTHDLLFDVTALSENVGLAEWHSPAQWNMAKLPFSSTYLPLYAEHVARLIATLRGKSRRCLILDLDNTVWGGVIGDDGLEGIQLAQGDAIGEAFLSVQRYALELRKRGILLAVSSKNYDEVARAPFRKHPEMLLREEHITVFQANWNDKAANIKAISEELSLGLDAMVLLDDNPIERDMVRQLLPQVAVPELPADPAYYVQTLSAGGYFEAVTFSDEDARRPALYQDNARRVTLQKQAGNVDSYLASLRMVITFQPFDAAGRARITQLINKSNQFNLTTRRYTEADVAALERDPNSFTLQVRLADTLGDNGMISVVICRLAGEDVWEIDTWLMSCRVLGRHVESAVLQELLNHAKQHSIRKFAGRYIPTQRNRLVEAHYEKLGFVPAGREFDGTAFWELDVALAQVIAPPMEVRRQGFEEATPIISH